MVCFVVSRLARRPDAKHHERLLAAHPSFFDGYTEVVCACAYLHLKVKHSQVSGRHVSVHEKGRPEERPFLSIDSFRGLHADEGLQ